MIFPCLYSTEIKAVHYWFQKAHPYITVKSAKWDQAEEGERLGTEGNVIISCLWQNFTPAFPEILLISVRRNESHEEPMMSFTILAGLPVPGQSCTCESDKGPVEL